MNETVSIIVPIYNVAAYLPICMDTLLAQTVTTLDIVLVDDGSTDDGGSLCDHYVLKDSRVRVIHKENGGLSSARNAGLDCAIGNYICFIDPDDYVELNLVEKAMAAMNSDNYDMCVYRTRHPYGDTVEFMPALYEKLTYRWSNEDEHSRFMASVFFPCKISWGVCGRMFRRSLIEQHHLRFVSEREVFAEDLLFTYLYLLHSHSVVYIPDCLYHYITRGDSLINTAKREMVLPKYSKLMKIALEYTKKADYAQIANSFPTYYTILLGYYGRNLWLHERIFTLSQVRSQFLSAEDLDFMNGQITQALASPQALYESQGTLIGKILLAQMRYIQSGNKLQFWLEAISPLGCLYIFNRLPHR